MATDQDVKRFTRTFVDLSESIRLLEPFNSEDTRKIHVLRFIRGFSEKNGRQITISDISRQTGIAMPNVSRFLRPLEESGYIERQRIGRNVYMHITADGDQLLAAKIEEASVILKQMLDTLLEEELSVYVNCSEKISSALNNIIEQQHGQDNKNQS
ncbi:MAG: winged helix-turn-helix transcriptional regulator [Clostridia bacterium]|nr:winged helix-turn-helix transcriptional regulator [Clostridia bacterium]